ncbi:hypothetical protein PF005_g23637 [Phytophthora fragariae]|uniref:START domain-containing protein n=1 Tax=Phytophthora fragariae TaxID=53985 RepID=A0A6A3QMF3_9STRA|nr:hypothetical protein PF009_g14855 [Phytophthora fragariae]KAE8982008.1 hypothetical protein PF011_g21800 [Phytophthora fragariae]KAE9079361.1 hypothetical protein PF010_g22781 [Phytophthora fragariae]KAE9079524.1 hypothetical protein PF007_g23408 [Phytophthora fragariae]KAE9101115.1 hypothetical protein PF006_g22744 [Phytophthora fragariae]
MAEKRYKSTNVRRKKEKEELLAEVRGLQSELQQLQPPRSQEGVRSENALLSSFIRHHQLEIASVQSICSLPVQTHPLYSHIRLKKSWHDRNETLLAIREQKFRAAYEHIVLRSQITPLNQPHLSDERFETADGDVCCILFQTVQLPGVESLKQVHEAVFYSVNNVEISISERLGHITIRDDYDGGDGNVHNARILSTNDIGISTELNCVMYSQFFDADDIYPPRGMVVIDSVDEDELYPYKSNERIRKDVSSAVVVTAYNPLVEGGDLTVVLRRAAFVKLYHQGFPISETAWQEAQQEAVTWGDVLLRTLRGLLYSVP